ncbi:MAG: hypothetical protein QOJ34_1007 [Pseudonocardiales bacterium]|jgi:hypothetical protein|nr:hypothetical protein [Pseudonocardiales bacterium]
MNHKRTVSAVSGLALLCAGIVAAAPAEASHGGGADAIRNSGQCAHGGGTWKLKAKPDDAGLEIEFEVDTNQIGQLWHVRITDNGNVVADRNVRTTAPSGSFSVQSRPANRAGVTDTIRAHAFRGDRVCGGQVQV